VRAVTAPSAEADRAALRSDGRARRFWRAFARNRGAIFGLVVLVFWIAVAVFAPQLAPRDPYELGMAGRVGPSWEYPLGTDRLGRDILSRIMYGARISLVMGVVAVAIGLAVGTLIGVVAGYFGGRLETVLMRAIDALLAFPGVLLALVIIAALGPSLVNVMIAVGISAIPEYARLARASTLSIKERPYIAGTRPGRGASGCRPGGRAPSAAPSAPPTAPGARAR
jgi:peptide/nickel transport system permease protein